MFSQQQYLQLSTGIPESCLNPLTIRTLISARSQSQILIINSLHHQQVSKPQRVWID